MKVSARCLLLVLPFSPTAFSLVQKAGLQVPASAAASKQQVVQMFTEAYGAYKTFAFGHDDLAPTSRSFVDSRNGWGATIVDSMSTMKIMGLDDLFQEAVAFVSQINFSRSKTRSTVSVFESTIRYVGGLLSAYQLNGNQPQVLVDKAQQLTNKLAFAFGMTSPIPFNTIDFVSNTIPLFSSNIAQAGTLTMEWATLSKLTGNSTYKILSENAAKRIAQNPAPLPGLAAQGIDPRTGNAVGAYVSWGGASDSYLEYLIKYPRLDPTVDPIFLNTWKTAVDSSIKFLLKNSTIGGHAYLAEFGDDRKIHHVGGHLTCFHGGNWILGGQLLGNRTITNIGLQLIDACWNMYASTATGIGPERYGFISNLNGQPPNGSDDGNFTGDAITADQIAFNSQHGFYTTNGIYDLRPETLESNFYAWRVTGNPKYLANAEAALASFQKYLPVPNAPGGVAGIFDVNNVNNTGHFDDAESFFFAEVMKYLYLTFDDPSHISLDEWIFNTEAHPFRAPALTGVLGG